tara:strand:+ start:1933 stop:2901 length:969 start_codon:yes stop_codon:yes gene_type:complete
MNLQYIPYIPLLINFDKKSFLNEVKRLPMYKYREWHSCTLYGLSPEKNLSNKHYGFDESSEKNWFFEKECPVIIHWLKSQKYFSIDRARVWKVSPGEIGKPHTDTSKPTQKNLIIPIYTPKGFESKVCGLKVPMETPVVYNNYLEHSFENASNEDRWSLIIKVNKWMSKSLTQNVQISKKNVKEINWETFVKFLICKNHVTFAHMQQTKQYCAKLGELKSKNLNPQYTHWGLFDDTKLIGVTSIQDFTDLNFLPNNAKRYRYLYIDETYRGNNLGYKLLQYLVPNDPLFGYAKEDHISWCYKHGFKPLLEKDESQHQFMLRP